MAEHTVEMIRPTDVVARYNSNKGSSAVSSRRLHASKSVGLDCRSRTIAVALSLYTSVDASGVTTPKLNVCIRDRFAGRGINEVDIQVGNGTLLTGQDVLSYKLASNPFYKSVFRSSRP